MPLDIDSSTSKAYAHATQATDSSLGCIKTGYNSTTYSNIGASFTKGETTGTVYLNLNITKEELFKFACYNYNYSSTTLYETNENKTTFDWTVGEPIITFGNYSLYLKIVNNTGSSNDAIIAVALKSSVDNSGYILENKSENVSNTSGSYSSKAYKWYLADNLTSITSLTEITDSAVTALSGLTITLGSDNIKYLYIISNGTPFTNIYDNEKGIKTDSSGNGYVVTKNLDKNFLDYTLELGKINSTCKNFRIISSTIADDTMYSISPCMLTNAKSTEGSGHILNMPYAGCIEYVPFIGFENSHTNLSHLFQAFDMLVVAPSMITTGVTNIDDLFRGCGKLNTVPIYDTSSVTTAKEVFYACSNLVVIPEWDVSSVTDFTDFVYGCKKLRRIGMYGMKVSFDISVSTCFIEQNLVEILENLATVTTTQTLTMGSTNLAKLTDAEKAIATNKGWTLA